jgi:PAS domain S-box-containing protein
LAVPDCPDGTNPMVIKEALLQKICDTIADEIDAVVSIFAERGKIVASSRRKRIGDFHSGAARLMAGKADYFTVTAAQAKKSATMMEGYTMPIEIRGKRVLCVGVAAPLGIARAYCRVVQHWVQAILKENELSFSEQRFRDVADSAGDWIWEMDSDLRFTYLSPRFFELFPVLPERIIGKTREEFAGQALDDPHWRAHHAKLVAHQPFRDFAYTTARPDGSVGYIQISGKPIDDPSGRFAGYRGTGRDITEQNLAALALRRSEQRLKDAIETISEGFSLFDSDDRLIIFNTKYLALLYPEADVELVPGMTFEAIIRQAANRGYIKEADGQIDEWVQQRLERRRKSGEPHIQQRNDGRWIMVSERRTNDGGTVAVYSDITELKQREEELAGKSDAMELLSKRLARYLSPQIYDSVFSGRTEAKIASQRKKLTVFFSDIAGFTKASERMEPEDLTNLLNHYLTEMSVIALQHGATIDKFVGDAIVIFFGDPETLGVKEDALACVGMAVAMRDRMAELQSIWRTAGIERPLQCRIGINTGYCTVGNFGSENRLDYTIIGAGVNLASRLESIAEPGEILVSYETSALINDEFRCESRGEISVKGMAYPVTAYRVVGRRQSIDCEHDLIRVEEPKFRLEIDLRTMSGDQMGQVAAGLRRALRQVSKLKRAEQKQKDSSARKKSTNSQPC